MASASIRFFMKDADAVKDADADQCKRTLRWCLFCEERPCIKVVISFSVNYNMFYNIKIFKNSKQLYSTGVMRETHCSMSCNQCWITLLQPIRGAISIYIKWCISNLCDCLFDAKPLPTTVLIYCQWIAFNVIWIQMLIFWFKGMHLNVSFSLAASVC